jgi:four helix bundle protein
MGVAKLEDLMAYQAARSFKLAVYELVNGSDRARADDRYHSQVFDAAASVEMNIAEGFRRFSAAEFCQFLRYSRASLEETLRWLDDGVVRGYFAKSNLAAIQPLAESSARLTIALWRSLQPFVKKGR